MDPIEDQQPKRKRERKKPTKKLSFEEEKALIEYIMSNRDIEKPTAQSYYRKFSAVTKVEVDWKLVRAKVRNLRTNYNKAKSWEGSTGEGSMEGETLKATLLKMCKFFYELEDIFGNRFVENVIIEESLHSIIESDCTESYFEENPTSDSTQIENSASTSRKFKNS